MLAICASHNPEFLALYGRRRIGKTHLIRAFFTNRDDVVFFNTTGSKDGSMVEQIHHFTKEIGDTFYKGAKLEREKNWDNTFGILTNALKNAPNNKKIILFIDELPWMATRNSRFLQSIDYYWNQHWSRDSRVKLIICGSSASWIIHKILKAKGGLHNRITKKIRLEPLDLRQAKLYLQALGIKLNDQQTLQLYMVTGGVPYYLSALKKGLSAIQQIERIAFMKDGLLIDEFDNLFDALFDNGDLYRRIIKIIAKQRYGIGKRKLLEAIGKNAVGSYGSRLLDNLEEAGFIKSFKPLFHKKKGYYYRVIDEYTLFYLKWIEPIKETLQTESLEPGNWEALQHSPDWHSWQGYAFESVCYKHLAKIRKALSISPTAMASTWRYTPIKNNHDESGAQIDLLFDRTDDSITICEIKHSNKAFAISKSYAENLEQKLKVFRQQTRTKKHLFLTLLTSSGVAENKYYDELIDGHTLLDDLLR